MADFLHKLNKLQKVEGPPRVDLTTLTAAEGYLVMKARFHTHETFGTSIIVDLMVGEQPMVGFLPKRFALSLCQRDLDELSSGSFRLRCTGVTNKSPDITFFKV